MKKIIFLGLTVLITTLQSFAIAPWLKIAAADAGAGFIGACEGSTFGPWGTAAGGLLCGVCGSVGAAYPIAPHPQSKYDGVTAYSNENNKFNYVAIAHNNVLINYYQSNTGILDYNQAIALAKNAQPSGNFDFTKINSESLLQKAKTLVAQDLSTNTYLVNISKTYAFSQNAQKINVDFWNEVYQATTLEQVVTISSKYESLIISKSGGLSEKEFNSLSIMISTLKYSSAFWIKTV